jgi:hypothetical protein
MAASRSVRPPTVVLAPQQLAHAPVRFFDELGDDVLVAGGHRRGRPAEHAHHDALVDAPDEQEGRGGVPGVMETGGPDGGALRERRPLQGLVAGRDGSAGDVEDQETELTRRVCRPVARSVRVPPASRSQILMVPA